MAFPLSRIFRRMMSSNPTSHFITLPNRPIVQENGDTVQGPLKLHYWEWKGHQPTILFCHAASFHSRCYDRIINEALHGFHVISLDFRSHGRSQQHPPPYRFRWFGEDLLQLIETFDLPMNNLIGIGHSVGGHALTLAAAKAPRRLFQSLLLLDPAIFPPSIYQNIDDDHRDAFDSDQIRRRKSQWSSVKEMISRLEKRELFSRWPEDVLRNYCTYALDETYKLSCAPENEVSIYKSSIQSDSSIYPLIEKSKFINDIPIHIVRTTIPVSIDRLDASPTDPDLVKLFKKGRDTQMKEGKHLFPMEQPQLAVELVKKFLHESRTLNSHV
jgi:pimeloyl-ACP methyl ester carboxylesterase